MSKHNIIVKKNNSIRKKSDSLGVAPVIGFLLIMAILFLAAGQYQANVVPVQEREEEVNHFQRVGDQLNGLRTEIIRSSSNGNVQTQEVEIGLIYNTLGITQQSASGNLILRDVDEDDHNITIRNAENNGKASNFWRGDVKREYDTGLIEYDIDYNRFGDNSEIWMEHGLIYRDSIKDNYERINFIQDSQQPIINGRTVRLYTIQSGAENVNFTAGGRQPVTIELQPTSAPMSSVSVTNYSIGNDPINITLPTRLNKNHWNEILDSQIDSTCSDNDRYVENLEFDEIPTSKFSNIHINMCSNETYNLQMSRIDLQTRSSRSRIPQPEEKYVAVSDQVLDVREESIVNLEAQVRDRFNNGVTGVEVLAEAHETSSDNRCIGDFRGQISGDSTICQNVGKNAQPATSISDNNGDVFYTYEAPEVGTDEQVTFLYRFDS